MKIIIITAILFSGVAFLFKITLDNYRADKFVYSENLTIKSEAQNVYYLISNLAIKSESLIVSYESLPKPKTNSKVSWELKIFDKKTEHNNPKSNKIIDLNSCEIIFIGFQGVISENYRVWPSFGSVP
jgi:hypothetical protein